MKKSKSANNVPINTLYLIIQPINARKNFVLKDKNGILKRLNAQISLEYVSNTKNIHFRMKDVKKNVKYMKSIIRPRKYVDT